MNNRDSSVLRCKIIDVLGILYKGVQFLIIEASLLYSPAGLVSNITSLRVAAAHIHRWGRSFLTSIKHCIARGLININMNEQLWKMLSVCIAMIINRSTQSLSKLRRFLLK